MSRFDFPYYISGTGALTDAETLVPNSLKEAGIFRVDARFTPANEYGLTINFDRKYDEDDDREQSEALDPANQWR